MLKSYICRYILCAKTAILPMLHIMINFIFFYLYATIYVRNIEGTIILPNNVVVPAVIAFGDSFVDQGNNNCITTLVKANFPPYGKDFVGEKATGRFSNGKTLADFFANALGVKEYLPAYLDPSIQDKDLLTGVSFASGGSGYDPLTPIIMSAIPLSIQLGMFKQYIEKLKRNIGVKATDNIITNSVYMVVASTNDLIFTRPIRRLRYHDLTTYDSMLVKLVLSFVQELHKLGARRTVVFSAPPVGCIPVVRTLYGGPLRTCVEKENTAAQLFNNILKQQLQTFSSSIPESRVAFVDFYDPLINFLENPHQYDLEVTDRGCCGTGDIEVAILCNKLTPPCANDSKYLFWDSIHLSEKGCNILIDYILQDLMNTLF